MKFFLPISAGAILSSLRACTFIGATFMCVPIIQTTKGSEIEPSIVLAEAQARLKTQAGITNGADDQVNYSPLIMKVGQPSVDLAQGGLVKAPILPKQLEVAQNVGVPLAIFRLENNQSAKSNGNIISFGYVFARGAVQPDAKLIALYDDAKYRAQLDAKAFYTNGSVKHAIISMETPKVKGAGFADISLNQLEEAVLGEALPFPIKDIVEKKYNLPLSITFKPSIDVGGVGEVMPVSKPLPKSIQINVRDVLINHFDQLERKNDFSGSWLNGELVKEYRLEANAADHLQLRFDVRVYADGNILTDIIFANEKTFSSGIRDLTYDVTVGAGNNIVGDFKNVSHHRSSTWHRRVWSGQPSHLNVVYDVQDFFNTGAILPLDLSQGILSRIINQFDKASLNLAPLSPSIITQYFPTTGGRGDIGIYPQWAANYLVSQSPIAKRAMLALADAGGGVPWHFRDERTNAPVSVEVRPKFWIDERGQEQQYYPDRMHSDVLQSKTGGWEADQPHKPAFFYVPYLITGDRYYADELAMQAAWALSGRWPALREGGIKAIDIQQVRGSAWSLRDISDAAFILPNDDVTAAYMKRVLDTNLAMMQKKYVADRQRRNAVELEGYFDENIGNQPSRVSPWQQDYLMLALWLASHRGNDDAQALLSWGENFHTGRFLSPLFDFKRGSSYIFAVRDATTKEPYTDWQKVAQATYNNEILPAAANMEGYPDSASSYLASALATQLALTHSVGSLSAYEIIGKILLETRQNDIWSDSRDSSVYAENQYFFSIPSLKGDLLTRGNLKIDSLSFEKKALTKKKTDTKEEAVVYIGLKPQKIMGTDQGDILYGFHTDKEILGEAGDDLIFGGDGDNIIIAGMGDDIIIAGDGDDVLTGGEGSDVFAYLRGSLGRDVIKDFNIEHDKIGFSRFISEDAKAMLAAVQDSAEGALIELGDGNRILLLNITKQDLTTDHFKKVQ